MLKGSTASMKNYNQSRKLERERESVLRTVISMYHEWKQELKTNSYKMKTRIKSQCLQNHVASGLWFPLVTV